MNRKAEYYLELARNAKINTVEDYLKSDAELTQCAQAAKEMEEQAKPEISDLFQSHKKKCAELKEALAPIFKADELFREKMKAFAAREKLTSEMLPQDTKAIPVVEASWRIVDAEALPEDYLKTVPDTEKIEAVFKSLGNLTEIPGVEISETVKIKRIGGLKPRDGKNAQ